MSDLGERTTLCYKRLDQGSNLPLYLDIYHPSWKPDSELTTNCSEFLVPAVVYFHGGGLTVGNRNSWLPNWLKSQCNITLLSCNFTNQPRRSCNRSRLCIYFCWLSVATTCNRRRYSERYSRYILFSGHCQDWYQGFTLHFQDRPGRNGSRWYERWRAVRLLSCHALCFSETKGYRKHVWDGGRFFCEWWENFILNLDIWPS